MYRQIEPCNSKVSKWPTCSKGVTQHTFTLFTSALPLLCQYAQFCINFSERDREREERVREEGDRRRKEVTSGTIHGRRRWSTIYLEWEEAVGENWEQLDKDFPFFHCCLTPWRHLVLSIRAKRSALSKTLIFCILWACVLSLLSLLFSLTVQFLRIYVSVVL